jgi:hypothetical protein
LPGRLNKKAGWGRMARTLLDGFKPDTKKHIEAH